MSTGTDSRPRLRINGVAVFAGLVAMIALGIVIGGNLMFGRFLNKTVTASKAPAAPASATASSPAPASSAAPPVAPGPAKAFNRTPGMGQRATPPD